MYGLQGYLAHKKQRPPKTAGIGRVHGARRVEVGYREGQFRTPAWRTTQLQTVSLPTVSEALVSSFSPCQAGIQNYKTRPFVSWYPISMFTPHCLRGTLPPPFRFLPATSGHNCGFKNATFRFVVLNECVLPSVTHLPILSTTVFCTLH